MCNTVLHAKLHPQSSVSQTSCVTLCCMLSYILSHRSVRCHVSHCAAC